MRLATRLLLALAIFGGAGWAQAADITWQSDTLISGDSDVSTLGTLVYAYNIGPAGVQSTTVNGVLFQAWAFPANGTQFTTTQGQATISESPGQLYSSDTLGFAGGTFNSLSTEYQALLGSAGYADYNLTMTLTLDGLEFGKEYQFQWWANNSSLEKGVITDLQLRLVTSTAGNFVTLDSNSFGNQGDAGTFVIGTFIADATSQTIDFTGLGPGYLPMINAFQLREVPEPSTWALGTIATFVLGAAARRRGQFRAKA